MIITGKSTPGNSHPTLTISHQLSPALTNSHQLSPNSHQLSPTPTMVTRVLLL